MPTNALNYTVPPRLSTVTSSKEKSIHEIVRQTVASSYRRHLRAVGCLCAAEGVLSRVPVILMSVHAPQTSRGRETKQNVRDVEESVLVFVLLVDGAHQSRSRRKYLIDEDENGLLWRELDALSDDIDELADSQIRWDQVLLLVDSCNIRLLDLLADNLSKKFCQQSHQNKEKKNAGGDSDKRSKFVHTGMRSVYFCRMRSASALRFSKGCSSLNLERILMDVFNRFSCFVSR